MITVLENFCWFDLLARGMALLLLLDCEDCGGWYQETKQKGVLVFVCVCVPLSLSFLIRQQFGI